MDSVDIYHGLSGQSGQCPVSPWAKSSDTSQTGQCPWTLWTLSMDSVVIVHGLSGQSGQCPGCPSRLENVHGSMDSLDFVQSDLVKK